MSRMSMFVVALALTASTAFAQSLPPQPPPPDSPFASTKEERAACAPDVMKFCKHLIPPDPKAPVDALAISGCLQSNRAKISLACRNVLAGHGE